MHAQKRVAVQRPLGSDAHRGMTETEENGEWRLRRIPVAFIAAVQYIATRPRFRRTRFIFPAAFVSASKEEKWSAKK